MKNKLFVGIFVIALIACNNNSQKEKEQTLKKSKEVSISEIKTREFSHYIEVQGKVDGEDNVGVFAKTIGVVTNIFVNAGDEVKKGQILAQIDDQFVKQSIKEIQTQIDFTTDLYNKQKNLWEQKIGSEVQYLSAKTNKEAMENRKASALEQLDMFKIISPIDGTIEDIPIKVGQSVAPGLPIFRVINFSKIKVVADVAEVFTAKIKKGNDVLIYFPDLNQEMPAQLTFSSKYINPTNRTFAIEIRLQPSEIEYRANMIAIIKIKDYTSANAFALPVNIVQSDAKDKYVFVAENVNGKNIAKKQLVKTGQSYNGIIEITNGLKPGDKVITTGYQDLDDGQEIKY
ncbi:MAG: efflux RND transporter periplasmic adaptor subunit [Bacteroidales bacterium]|jgi:RND family efflux transporter MFP subunit